jgi:hypothetical protein
VGRRISRKGKKSKMKLSPFTGGEKLPTLRPRYFSHLYIFILFFLIFDSIILISAISDIYGFNTAIFLVFILFSILLIIFKAKQI